MKKIVMILFLFVITLYANDTELNTSEKQALLEWANTNCYENHKSFDTLLKDRYFSCEFRAKGYPGGLKGDVIFKTKANNLWAVPLISFFITVFFVAIIAGISLFIINISEQYHKDKPERVKKIQLNRRRFIMYLIGIFIVAIVSFSYLFLKDYSIETIRNGSLEDVKMVLPIFELVKKDETALLLAVSNGSFDIVKYLIEEIKYNPNEMGSIEHSLSYTPLDLALANQSYDIAEYLKQYLPKDKPVDIRTASKSFDMNLLKKSIKLGNYSEAEILDGFIVSIKYKDFNATQYLSSFLTSSALEKEGNIDLDKRGANFTYRGTPLSVAIENDNLEAVKLLVTKNIYINKCDALSYAASDNRAEIFNFFLENDTDAKLECPHDMIFQSIVRSRAYDVEKIVVEKGLIDEKEFKKVKEYGYY